MRYAVAEHTAYTLGMIHEQNRPDRDTMVTINWDNIIIGCEDNFELANNMSYTTWGTDYDHGSVTHFSHVVSGNV